MYQKTEEGGSPFELKVKGDFERALAEYARRYAESIESQNDFIAEVCFDQMFDICLLEHLRRGLRFKTKRELLEAIENRLMDVLSVEGSHRGEFQKRLTSCTRRLSPRGRGAPAFSVDPKWLLKATAEG